MPVIVRRADAWARVVAACPLAPIDVAAEGGRVFVMFLDAEGHRMDLVSPHPRYPYFYTPSMREALLANIGQALAHGG